MDGEINFMCGENLQNEIINGIIKKKHSRALKKSVILSHGPQVVSDVVFRSVMAALSKPVSSSPFTKFVDNLTSERKGPQYLAPDQLKRLHFLNSDSILVQAAMNRCTSLSDPPLFTPVM